MADLWLRNVRTSGSSTSVDVVVRGGRIVSVGEPPSDLPSDLPSDPWVGPVVDGGGRLVLAGLVDGHAHVDKTLWGLPWRPHSAGPGLVGLIANERTGRRELPSVLDRATALFEAYVATGTTLIRTHVDVDTENRTSAVEQVAAAAGRCAGRLDVQIVAFPQSGMLVEPGTVELMEEALFAGASVVGGIDPAGFDGDAVEHLDTIFELAAEHGCGIDLHLHDRGSLGRWQVELVVERTRALGLQGRVMISHAFCLCDGDPAIDPLLERLAAQRIALATVAPGNVEPLPLDRIVEFGIGLCLGQDGVRDLWSPWGDADMLARAGLMAWRAGYRRDADIELCVEIATTRGAAAIGIPDNAVAVGGRGDLVVVDASGTAEAAVVHPPRWLVVKGGAIVAGSAAAAGGARKVD